MTERISAADLRRYLDGKKVTKGCHTCGGTSFVVDDEEASGVRPVIVAPKFPGYHLPSARTTEIVVVFCTDCGVGQFYNRRTIADWLHANPED